MILEISANAAQLTEFIQVFGIRFLGLIDNSNVVYMTYRVPAPEAPYPQDYIIDQQGYVRYWSDEYDPQEIIRIIDQLLNVGSEEHGSKAEPVKISVRPNPFSKKTAIHYELRTRNYEETDKIPTIRIYDASGRLVKQFTQLSNNQLRNYEVTWSGEDDHGHELPAGVYILRLESANNIQSEQIIFIH